MATPPPTEKYKEFDPTKFIDRDFEREFFRTLLRFEDARRILAIKDAGGMGKSHLLEHFRYHCRTASDPRIPVCLLKLNQLADYSPLSVIHAIKDDLARFGLPFPNFDRLESARLSADLPSIIGYIQLGDATFDRAMGTQISGVRVDRAESVNIASGGRLNQEQEAFAQGKCIQAFFDDLNACCAGSPIVLLLDAYETCLSDDRLTLRDWITKDLLERLFDCQHRPAKFTLVIAGREIPSFHLHWSSTVCEQTVLSLTELRKWERRHIEECLRVYGHDDEPQDIEAFYYFIERGYPPSEVIRMIEISPRRRRHV